MPKHSATFGEESPACWFLVSGHLSGIATSQDLRIFGLSADVFLSVMSFLCSSLHETYWACGLLGTFIYCRFCKLASSKALISCMNPFPGSHGVLKSNQLRRSVSELLPTIRFVESIKHPTGNRQSPCEPSRHKAVPNVAYR